MRESVSGSESDRHAQVTNGLASARHLVAMVESFLKDRSAKIFGGNEELSNVAAVSAGPLPHEDCLAEDAFVDDVRGEVLEPESVKQEQQEEVKWCRGMGVWKPVLRKDMEAEGATAVALRWIDTDNRVGQTTGLDFVSVGRERDLEGDEEIRCSLCS